MKTKIIIAYSILFSAIISCNKEIKSEKGGIDVISNVYLNASQGLDKMKTFHLSRLSYSNDTILEIVPDIEFPEMNGEMYFITDSLYYSLGLTNASRTVFAEIVKKQKPNDITKKTTGTLFLKEWIPNYKNKKNLPDTILFKKNYKRFEVNSPWSYARFYIYPTDTILPYSIYKHAEVDYGGRLERIDSYNKKEDIFVTLQLIPRKNWDDEAKEIFDYNHYIKNRKK